jgi:hypothetical protein
VYAPEVDDGDGDGDTAIRSHHSTYLCFGGEAVVVCEYCAHPLVQQVASKLGDDRMVFSRLHGVASVRFKSRESLPVLQLLLGQCEANERLGIFEWKCGIDADG